MERSFRLDTKIIQELREFLTQEQIKTDVLLKDCTSFKTGGKAGLFLIPETEDELAGSLSLLKEKDIPYFILGKGSNLLVSDSGYAGAVIKLGEGLSQIQAEGTKIRAGAGASLAKVARVARQETLTGFEFAAGIPGTVGGAMVMNAGAYGGEMKDVVESVRLLLEDGSIREFTCEEMKFGYRTGILKEIKGVALETVFALQKGEGEAIDAKMQDFAARRREKQPLEYPSAGSTFKRPEGHFAGKLIGDAGLSGYAIGDAKVSEKHNGFVINTGNATAKDIRDLIFYLKEKVEKETGVVLEPEVIMVGEF